MKRVLSALVLGSALLLVVGCGDKAEFPSDTSKPVATVPGDTAPAPPALPPAPPK